MNSMTEPHNVHEGRNVKRIREILGVKQETLAIDLGLSQQAISNLEQRETIEPDLLHEVAGVLKVPVEAIKNFNEEAAINIIANTVTNYDNGALFNYQPTFNPIDKIVQLYDEKVRLLERLLRAEKDKVELLERMMKEK